MKRRYVNTTHGGNVFDAAARLGISPDEILDFSANINPLGPPAAVLESLQRNASDTKYITRYPDIDSKDLRQVISKHLNIDKNLVIIGNGASALINTAVHAINPTRCLLPVPCFSEYTRALSTIDCEPLHFNLTSKAGFNIDIDRFKYSLHKHKPQFCIISNPHNPSGALTQSAKIKSVISEAEIIGTTILLDEAFIDYVPEESLIERVTEYSNLIVLRSLTKFYAIPAMRVGYAVASNNLVALLQRQTVSWPVSTVASDAAIAALQDNQYAIRTIAGNKAEREWLAQELTQLGVKVFSSQANFILIQLPEDAPASPELKENLLAQHHVLIRDCSTFTGLENKRFIRVAVRSRRDNRILIRALGDCLW
ncbi:MAG: threonine-phosphate decarboxylase CobD [Pyrinomonadaceae bacterium]